MLLSPAVAVRAPGEILAWPTDSSRMNGGGSWGSASGAGAWAEDLPRTAHDALASVLDHCTGCKVHNFPSEGK